MSCSRVGGGRAECTDRGELRSVRDPIAAKNRCKPGSEQKTNSEIKASKYIVSSEKLTNRTKKPSNDDPEFFNLLKTQYPCHPALLRSFFSISILSPLEFNMSAVSLLHAYFFLACRLVLARLVSIPTVPPHSLFVRFCASFFCDCVARSFTRR